MFIEPFKVEIWMNEWETRCTYNLAETCVASITIQELLSLSGLNESALSDLLPMKLTYGDIEGSSRLRAAIASLYEAQVIEDITVTHGTIAANMLVHKALLITQVVFLNFAHGVAGQFVHQDQFAGMLKPGQAFAH